ncbi:MAG: acetoin dehydrogenase dihydrolipoyllysine-residue acetyltransferase subunit [Sedimentitalea sp.]|uniref:acetoin dehydrogenase dihydrolipoyllysine-residue acetyltransferase subunit n=1 Tax=Sedimentitalea sp. TaxID=2048915 RepID=UPI003264C20A
MATEVIMPKVDMDMETGKISAWHVAEGEAVAKGAALFDIETDKAAMEVEAPATGTLRHVIAKIDDVIAVGRPLGWIYAEGEEVPEEPPVTVQAKAPTASPPQNPTAPAGNPAPLSETVADIKTTDTIRATPAARKLAREQRLDLSTVTGTGPRSRIQRDDIEGHNATLTQQPSAGWQPEAGPLAVSRTGTGTDAPVVLIHGFSGDAMGWRPLEQALLGAGREFIRIELPSHGKSPRRHVSDFAKLARMVVQAFDDLGHESAHVVGHSLGGAVASALTDIRSRRVATLGLIAPAGLGAEIEGDVLLGLARATRTASLAPWLKRLAATDDAISEDFARAAMNARSDPELRAAQLDLANILFPDGTQSFDIRPALSRIEVPVSVIWGRADRILPWRQALQLPGHAALHLLPDVGHIPHIEQPETVAKLLIRLFKQAEN